MKNRTETYRKMAGYLNNPEKEGGFWLPNIQRSFVWDEGQIERLFDSMMREYPISTLLVWKTKSNVKTRKFIDNYRHGLRLSDFFNPEDDTMKMLVLDGQQRLQSLFIGLRESVLQGIERLKCRSDSLIRSLQDAVSAYSVTIRNTDGDKHIMDTNGTKAMQLAITRGYDPFWIPYGAAIFCPKEVISETVVCAKGVYYPKILNHTGQVRDN